MNKEILTAENIILGSDIKDKWEAIQMCGKVLVDNGYVKPEYIDDMMERERSSSVYIGNHVAIPHGLVTSDSKIMESGISFLQIPNGISFGNEEAYMFIGIAGKGDTHMEILGKIGMACSDLDNVEILRTTQDKAKVIEILLGK